MFLLVCTYSTYKTNIFLSITFPAQHCMESNVRQLLSYKRRTVGRSVIVETKRPNVIIKKISCLQRKGEVAWKQDGWGATEGPCKDNVALWTRRLIINISSVEAQVGVEHTKCNFSRSARVKPNERSNEALHAVRVIGNTKWVFIYQIIRKY